MDIDKIVDQVRQRLLKTKENWDGLGSPRPSEKCIECSTKLVRNVLEQKLVPSSIGPSFAGGCSITFRAREGRELVLEIASDGDFELVLISNGEVQLLQCSTEEACKIAKLFTQTNSRRN